MDEAKKCFGEADSKQLLMLMFTDARRCSPAHATQITELTAEMVDHDLRPLSVVGGDGFHQLLNYIEPSYQVPSRSHIQSVCQKLYASAKKKLLVTLQSHHVAFTSDLWTSRAVQAYLTVTAHFIMWKAPELHFPIISKLAKQLLCIPATSVSPSRENLLYKWTNSQQAEG